MTDKSKERRRRKRSAKSPRHTHAPERHGRTAPPAKLPTEAVPISIDGHVIGELHVQPGTEEEVTARAITTFAGLRNWSQAGVEIVDLGEHRLEIAAHAARVAATGGREVFAEEEARIESWFRGVVETAIQRGGVRAARAIWFVLASDSQRDPRGTWTARCPALDMIGVRLLPAENVEQVQQEMSEQEVADFLAALPDAAVSYVRYAVASATAEDITELRELIHADDDALDAIYAPEPFAPAEHDPQEAIYVAMSALTRRRFNNDQISGAVESWAVGSQIAVQEHAWEPPVRIGVCAWLARVALRREEQAA